MSSEETLYIEIGHSIPNSEQSQMFGKPCFKVNGKAFIAFFQNEMVFKLEGESHSLAINLEGAQLFDPSGKKRPMKAWVQVPYVFSDQWTAFANAAAEFVIETSR
ncbi:hypothetical protein [Crocinitomix catalasitica]|uniref:hypothetical protein n=1 Tax=Crocinitomix catalasitica TaxID=184607 RepID=UPI000684A1B5|nr:hypothetical protein [Crocinitomix catalasitica]